MKSKNENSYLYKIKNKYISLILFDIVIQIIIPSYNQVKANYSKNFIFLIFRES